MDKLIYAVPILGVIGLLFTFMKYSFVGSDRDSGDGELEPLSSLRMASDARDTRSSSSFQIMAHVPSNCSIKSVGSDRDTFEFLKSKVFVVEGQY